jgi:hypothetical protein
VRAEVQAIVAVPMYFGSETLFSIRTNNDRDEPNSADRDGGGTPYFYIDND